MQYHHFAKNILKHTAAQGICPLRLTKGVKISLAASYDIVTSYRAEPFNH